MGLRKKGKWLHIGRLEMDTIVNPRMRRKSNIKIIPGYETIFKINLPGKGTLKTWNF